VHAGDWRLTGPGAGSGGLAAGAGVYLEFLAGRCRPNTVLAAASDLRVFFSVVGKPPEQVRPADVLAFITAQRTGRVGGRGALQPAGRGDEPGGVSAATVRRRLPRILSPAEVACLVSRLPGRREIISGGRRRRGKGIGGMKFVVVTVLAAGLAASGWIAYLVRPPVVHTAIHTVVHTRTVTRTPPAKIVPKITYKTRWRTRTVDVPDPAVVNCIHVLYGSIQSWYQNGGQVPNGWRDERCIAYTP
jgi:hypothetical protein